MLEGLIIGVFVISCFSFLYSSIRPYFKARVNCWFCNTNQWVPFTKQNSFKCANCDQYNGFNKSGDYNRRFPKMFTEAANAVSSAIRTATVGPKIPAANGLCDTCNKLQNVLMERLHKFEAQNESNYFDEYEAYKHRLDQQYPLCERCEAYTMQKLRLTQVNYVSPAVSTVSGFGRPPSSSGSSKSSNGSQVLEKRHSHKNRRRKLFFGSGVRTISATALNTVASLILFIVFYETTPVELPFHVAPKYLAEYVLSLAPAIAAGSTGAFFFGFKSSKSRVTFLDLIGCVAWPAFTVFCLMDSSSKYDFHFLGIFASIFMNLLSMASLFIPRKPKHRKRPNTIYSAFSIASTPMSQCSSRLSTSRPNLSVLPDDVSGIMEYEPMDTSNNVPDFNDVDNRSLFVGSTPSSKRTKAYLQYRERREMSSREGTPAKEINTGLNNLNLDGSLFHDNLGNVDKDVDNAWSTRTSILSPKALTPSKKRVNSPFSSMTYNSNVRRNQQFSSFSNNPRSNAVGSVFSDITAPSSLSSKFSSVSSPNNRQRFGPRAPLSFAAPSEVLTSVSQQQNSSNTAFYLAWITAVVALVALIAQSVYIFYYHQPVVVISQNDAQNLASKIVASQPADY